MDDRQARTNPTEKKMKMVMAIISGTDESGAVRSLELNSPVALSPHAIDTWLYKHPTIETFDAIETVQDASVKFIELEPGMKPSTLVKDVNRLIKKYGDVPIDVTESYGNLNIRPRVYKQQKTSYKVMRSMKSSWVPTKFWS
jgi:hypothetical protein